MRRAYALAGSSPASATNYFKLWQTSQSALTFKVVPRALPVTGLQLRTADISLLLVFSTPHQIRSVCTTSSTPPSKLTESQLLFACVDAFWSNEFKDETLSSLHRMRAVLSVLDESGYLKQLPSSHPKMKFQIGDRVGKRKPSANLSAPNKTGVIVEYGASTTRTGTKKPFYVVKNDQTGKLEEWAPGTVYLCSDASADRVAFV